MPKRLIAGLLFMLVMVLAVGGWALQQARARAVVARGHELFYGGAPLAGRITGHAVALPGSAARCVNCHEARSNAVGAAASAVAGAGGRYGPWIGREALTQSRARRGGPPSRYDAATFCALLRTGVDPAQVMIPQAMPRYEIGDADCEALWRYLMIR